MDDYLMASTVDGRVFTCCGGKGRHEVWCNRERTKRQQRGRVEPFTAADVRELIREHDRRLAARLRELGKATRAECPGDQGEGMAAALAATMAGTFDALADILEADDG